jgi:oligo-1,6-glucosidase
MNREVLSKYNVMSVAEGAGASLNTAMNFVDPDSNELNMLYHFDGALLGTLPNEYKTLDPKGYNLIDFKTIYSRWDSLFAEKGWGTIYLGNHDLPRMATRWGNDSPEFRELSSKMLTTFLLTMRATPYYYFGDELGMTNIKFDKIDDYRDIETINMYKNTLDKKGDLKKFLENQKLTARDNSRTPFQWDNSANAGFTTGTPWLKVNPNYPTVNVAAQENDPNSVLNYFRKLINLRKKEFTLIYGKYTLLDKNNPDIYAYTREFEGKKMLVLLNFRAKNASASIGDIDMSKANLIVDNYNAEGVEPLNLRPYEAKIYELK